MRFACNRTVAPGLDLSAFLDLAGRAGAVAVEVRNDVEGREFADGTPARELAARIADAGLEVASINALQRFNDWTTERAMEARALFAYAAELGAPGVVLCPVIDENHGLGVGDLAEGLRRSLTELRKIAIDSGVKGLVEPLSLKGSTLVRQDVAIEAIGDVDGLGALALCHDTFQFYRGADDRVFAEHVALVHVSGITRRDVPFQDLVEPDRGLVTDRDRASTVGQLRALLAAGYTGYVSMEPFDPAIQTDPDLRSALAASFAYLQGAVD